MFFSFKDGVDLVEDARVTVNRDCAPHGSYEIVLHKVAAGDAGSYSALATNSVGSEECMAAVSVKGKKYLSNNEIYNSGAPLSFYLSNIAV